VGNGPVPAGLTSFPTSETPSCSQRIGSNGRINLSPPVASHRIEGYQPALSVTITKLSSYIRMGCGAGRAGFCRPGMSCHSHAVPGADLVSPPRTRLGAAILVAILHVAAVFFLIRAFAPGMVSDVTGEVIAAFTVAPPTPETTPEKQQSDPAGAAAPAGKRAIPRERAAPKPKVELVTPDEASIAGKGDLGERTGAGGQGSGDGSGAGGSGRGAGGGARAAKIAGDINSARDYPRESRDLRIGDHVIVALTVGPDGRVRSCRVSRASKDPEADRITCRLATERFRFRAATDAAGNPVESVFGWRQRWFYPEGKK
jgi:periplasmic protein TonB